MNPRLFLIALVLFCFFVSYMSITHISIANAITSQKYDLPNKPSDVIITTVKNEKGEQKIPLSVDKMLFNLIPHYDQNGQFKSLTMKLKPDLAKTYQKLGYPSKSRNVVFVYPIITQAAYEDKGFYDYYNKKCDTSCTTVPIPLGIRGSYPSSIATAFALTLLNYSSINDIDVDKNPDILKKYDKIIILHNEYVTQREFDAITHHPDVVYLFPNALYAKVTIDYQQGSITLIKGHGYPNANITNGFRWKNDNSKYEYDFQCNNWNFYPVDNGKMLNCYPDYRVLYDKSLLQAIKN